MGKEMKNGKNSKGNCRENIFRKRKSRRQLIFLWWVTNPKGQRRQLIFLWRVRNPKLHQTRWIKKKTQIFCTSYAWTTGSVCTFNYTPNRFSQKYQFFFKFIESRWMFHRVCFAWNRYKGFTARDITFRTLLVLRSTKQWH